MNACAIAPAGTYDTDPRTYEVVFNKDLDPALKATRGSFRVVHFQGQMSAQRLSD